MSELRLIQFAFELLKNRIDGIEAGTDMRGLHKGQDKLSNRTRRFEESVNLHHVNESLNRVIRLEASVGRGHVGESLRQRQERVSQCEAGLTDLENRMRTQDWWHDLSEQESSDEIHRIVDGRARRAAPKRRMVAQAKVPIGEPERMFTQLRDEAQTYGVDKRGYPSKNNSVHGRTSKKRDQQSKCR